MSGEQNANNRDAPELWSMLIDSWSSLCPVSRLLDR